MAFQFAPGPIFQTMPATAIGDLTAPTGGAIISVTNNANGSVRATWGAATDATTPIYYEVYVQKATATGIFSVTPFLSSGLFLDLTNYSNGDAIVQGDVVFAGVRPVDGVGNRSSITTTASVTVTGVNYASLLSLIPPAVWDVLQSAHVTAGTFGLALDAAITSRLAAASYTAPDNATISAIAGFVDTEVSAIKAKTDNLPSDPASDTTVNTRLAAASYTAPDNAGVAAIKVKTDQITFTLGLVDAIAQTVADKTGYALTAGERTAIAAAIDASTILAKEATSAAIKSNTDLIPAAL